MSTRLLSIGRRRASARRRGSSRTHSSSPTTSSDTGAPPEREARGGWAPARTSDIPCGCEARSATWIRISAPSVSVKWNSLSVDDGTVTTASSAWTQASACGCGSGRHRRRRAARRPARRRRPGSASRPFVPRNVVVLAGRWAREWSRRMFVREERSMSITSERTTPMRIPPRTPKKRIPSPAPMKNTKSARFDPVVALERERSVTSPIIASITTAPSVALGQVLEQTTRGTAS